jgi:hypothetical protein
MLKQIISGGQTGADLAGLEAARALNIPTGGTAPRGYRCEGPGGCDSNNLNLKQYGLVEHTSRQYPPRTKQNVLDSDGTVWFGLILGSKGFHLTDRLCKQHNKPNHKQCWCCHSDPSSPQCCQP